MDISAHLRTPRGVDGVIQVGASPLTYAHNSSKFLLRCSRSLKEQLTRRFYALTDVVASQSFFFFFEVPIFVNN